MTRYTIPASIALALVLHLGGCERQAASPVDKAELAPTEAIVTPLPSASPVAAPIAVPAKPAAQFPAAERDPKAVLAWWKAALERRDWVAVRSAWGDLGERSGLSMQDFVRTWDRYRTVAVELGEGQGDAGAGSLYYEAPLTISGTLQDGTPYRRSGTVLIRRVNDVDGASAEQLRWHIEKLDLQP